MAALKSFECFNSLPKELRILIWEYHFESSRLLVVHPAPESQNRNPKREVLLFRCTVLDSATNLVIQDALPLSPLINREAHAVAVSCKRVWTPVQFGKDLAESVVSGRGRTPLHFSPINGTGQVAEDDIKQAHVRPVYVDWNRDMLYLCVSHAEQAFWSLRSVPWRNRIQKLAVVVPQSEFDRAIPFGPTDPIREVLECLKGLQQLLVVLVPQTGVVVPGATPTAVTGLPRDTFGFVPYVNYLKEAGLASNHMLYTRTAMSFREAIAGLPRTVKLERVVDVDYLASDYGHYRRGSSPSN
ncbi:hypothetical protein F5Y05DRAFT_104714 [Hypoxylon sp. FL0543]|nr:hypothetical protein F5Y05DRAFT_104714 [Hypoxylon sp. FL0543]